MALIKSQAAKATFPQEIRHQYTQFDFFERLFSWGSYKYFLKTLELNAQTNEQNIEKRFFHKQVFEFYFTPMPT